MTYYRTCVTHCFLLKINQCTISQPLYKADISSVSDPHSSVPPVSLRLWSDSELVGFMAWDATSSLVGGNIAVDRENFDIAVCHIPGHHGYLEDLQLVSRHHRSVNLLDAPVKVVLEMLLDLLLGLVGKAQSFKRIVQVDEPFGNDIGAVLAIGTMLGVGVYKLAMATNEVIR